MGANIGSNPSILAGNSPLWVAARWCNSGVTTTTTQDDGTSGDISLPSYEEVWEALQVLRRGAGITVGKVDAAPHGATLKRLPMSQDEFQRIGAPSGQLALAAIKALKCHVDSYNKPSYTIRGTKDTADARWVILRHELNLDQSIGLIFQDRQEQARVALDFSKDAYKERAASIYRVFVGEILELTESRCRPAGEWVNREINKFSRLTRQQLLETLENLLLRLGPVAYRDVALTLSVLSQAMPNLAAALRRYDIEAERPGAGDIIFATLTVFGAAYYDDAAHWYLTYIDSDVVLLPWDVLSLLWFTPEWPSADDYLGAGKDADYALEYDTWPLPIAPEYRLRFDETGELFLAHSPHHPTEVFFEALRASMRLFAQLLTQLDFLGEWLAQKDPKYADGKITYFGWYPDDPKGFNLSNVTFDLISLSDIPEVPNSTNESGPQGQQIAGLAEPPIAGLAEPPEAEA